MTDFAVQIANVIIGFIPYLIVVIIVILVIAFLARRKGKKEEDIERPPIIEPEEKFIDLQKKLLRSQGRKLNHKSLLKFNGIPQCNVMRYMTIPLSEIENIDLGKIEKKNKKAYAEEIGIIKEQIEELRKNEINTDLIDSSIKLLETEQKQNNPDNHYILETLDFGFINRLLYAFGYRMDFRIIPMDLLSTTNSQNFNCPINLYGKPFFDRIYTYSMAAEKYVVDWHDHFTLRQTLKEQVNFIPQMHYFDYKTGRFAAKSQEIANIKDKSYKKREAKFGGQEIPEDESLSE